MGGGPRSAAGLSGRAVTDGAAASCAWAGTRPQHWPGLRPSAAPSPPLRLRLIGLGSEAGFACPLNQYLLSDALGLTAIHLNRVLRKLREQGLVTFRDGQVVFHNLPRLQHLAQHHGGYLDQAAGLTD